ncbi:hypothetical protein EYF80_062955 [Liparis tanakae]|uniref:Uncharacterized protein n=1 Tax=Liparis tanakae TaxID=230148 RepID=A0A4Z2EDV4_9TELE|nr:hypothetical protein EYF80_062955 [Liparis tanakae]
MQSLNRSMKLLGLALGGLSVEKMLGRGLSSSPSSARLWKRSLKEATNGEFWKAFWKGFWKGLGAGLGAGLLPDWPMVDGRRSEVGSLMHWERGEGSAESRALSSVWSDAVLPYGSIAPGQSQGQGRGQGQSQGQSQEPSVEDTMLPIPAPLSVKTGVASKLVSLERSVPNMLITATISRKLRERESRRRRVPDEEERRWADGEPFIRHVSLPANRSVVALEAAGPANGCAPHGVPE